MKKTFILLFVILSGSLAAYDPVHQYLDDKHPDSKKKQPKIHRLMGKGYLDLVYIKDRFYFYPKVQFFRINFLRPHDNHYMYLMSFQITTGVFQGLGGDSEGVLLPYQMISSDCGLINIGLKFRSTFHNYHQKVGYMGVQAITSLKFNAYNTHNTNSGEIEKTVFPSFLVELSLFGQRDLGMGEVESSKDKHHQTFPLVGFFNIGGMYAHAEKDKIRTAFNISDYDPGYGFFAEVGLLIGQQHDFRIRLMKMLGNKDFVHQIPGYNDFLYRISFNMNF